MRNRNLKKKNEIIMKSLYSSYFLIVWDHVRFLSSFNTILSLCMKFIFFFCVSLSQFFLLWRINESTRCLFYVPIQMTYGVYVNVHSIDCHYCFISFVYICVFRNQCVSVCVCEKKKNFASALFVRTKKKNICVWRCNSTK